MYVYMYVCMYVLGMYVRMYVCMHVCITKFCPSSDFVKENLVLTLTVIFLIVHITTCSVNLPKFSDQTLYFSQQEKGTFACGTYYSV